MRLSFPYLRLKHLLYLWNTWFLHINTSWCFLYRGEVMECIVDLPDLWQSRPLSYPDLSSFWSSADHREEISHYLKYWCRIFSSFSLKYAKLCVNFWGLQLEFELFLSALGNLWSDRLDSGVLRGIVGTWKHSIYRVRFHYTVKTVGEWAFSPSCYNSNQKNL